MEFYATICRLCEATDKLDGKWADLFAAEHEQLLRRIQALTNIEIHQNDRLPKRICGQCQTSLEQAYSFKLQCEMTNKKLHHEIDFLEKNDWNTKLPIPPIDISGFPPQKEHVKQETKKDILEETLFIKAELSDDELQQQQEADYPEDYCVSKLEAMFASGDDDDDRDGSAESRSSSESSSSESSSSSSSEDDSEDSQPKRKRKRGRPRLSDKSSRKPRSSVCDTCGQQFAKPKLMYAHVRSAHGDRRFKCRFCPKTFVRNARLKEHERQHTGERDFQCDQCERKYPTARGLKVHMEDIHSENLPYVCDKCGKGFAKEGKLRQHYSAHLDIRKYVCTVCSKGFKTRTNLNLHVQIHLPPDQRKMRKRENQHKVCICPFCGKVSTSLGTHNMHIRTHTGEQRYECEICHKRFTSSGSHQKHMRVHSGEKPFVCEFCQKSFRQKHHLTTHMRGVHKNENPEAYVRPGICGRPRGVAAKTPGTAAGGVPVAPPAMPQAPSPVEDAGKYSGQAGPAGVGIGTEGEVVLNPGVIQPEMYFHSQTP
uniref:Putative c2h2-type zn-finger protein n=1 Tax=Culex tarsalis TaxID=7177 RepID=A0A1Q3F449_CULTA